MHTIYNLLIQFASFGLRIVALFSNKMKLFVDGRKDVFEILQQKISLEDKTIWFHCASLGEFEQGVPIMEAMKKLKPNHKIVVSFFSPSGFENKKNTPLADAVVYLPMDTQLNAKRFIEAIHPSIALFVKYEFWPNYLFLLQKKNIPTLLVSGVFRENQIFFKSYGGFMRNALSTFKHFFVQEENSEILLKNIGFKNVTVSGDTRFDRVSHQIEMDNTLKFAEDFKGNSLCIVCGSTWPEDEVLLVNYINTSPENVKFIIAPHKIEADKIEDFRRKINKKSILHSDKDEVNISEYEVLIIDCIGLLGKLYSYADIAFVGGAAGKTGLHNILEPATFGVPIVIGKNYDEFPEAIRLRDLAGLYSVTNSEECSAILNKFITNANFRNQTGMICGHFVNKNTGATQKVVDYISVHFE
ncbi:3-deoxy-D-manno-octulosonic-acid transferase [Aequorivita sublithincola DSM 14238]|uniref:3-deoxy-D-manno-octulosonic acid transferase n=1 Tax=Aequorivita sublithincola (strain DSM 14238 / LMG 21431 / ACAM 643 / 9-3) TaxID=746697 RepID=I3YTC0_AEQSU|nr:glycosyltransferase N-terminal domain-containing protein [Aequorivita sublithincola]AFL80238.1 3-deoxy-D-manno-octulosonic-acid transferase [Aequorivita sublithincola DSM 14238]